MPFERPTGKYLEMRLKHLIMSQSVVHNPKVQVRNARFRENNARLSDQYEFFPEKQNDGKMPYFILVHGYKKAGFELSEPEFAHFGYPLLNMRKEWGWLSQNIMEIPYIAADSSDTEDTEADFEAIHLLKEDIERWKRNND